MPKGAYSDLMDAVKSYEKSGAGDRSREKDKRTREEEQARAQAEEKARLERESKAATGARVRQGFKNREEMRDAINSEKASGTLGAPAFKRSPSGGVRG